MSIRSALGHRSSPCSFTRADWEHGGLRRVTLIWALYSPFITQSLLAGGADRPLAHSGAPHRAGCEDER
jgi:hypothetical protein